jgi:membrane protease YdiL (CAAX protease family)
MLRSLHVTVATVKVGLRTKATQEGDDRGSMSSKHIPHEAAAVGPTKTPVIPGRRVGAIAVLILLLLPWPRWLFPQEGLSAQPLRELVFWLMTVLLLSYVLFGERRSLGSIGLVKPSWKSLVWGVGGAAVTVAGLAVIYLVIFPALGLPAEEQQLGGLLALPLWLRVALVTRAAVFEELCYRGFAIERITESSGKRWLAALVSLALFTLGHLDYWGWTHLIVAGFGGLVLTVLYLLRRDLASNMLAHWLTDGVGFLLS